MRKATDHSPKRIIGRPAPHGWGGYVCQLFCLETFANFLQRMAKDAISIDKLYRKYITRGYVCQFGGAHTMLANIRSQENIFLKELTHQFWPPRTSPDSC